MPKKIKEQLEDALADKKVYHDEMIKKQRQCDNLALKLKSQKERFDQEKQTLQAEKQDLRSKVTDLKISADQLEGRITTLIDIIKNLSLHLVSSK